MSLTPAPRPPRVLAIAGSDSSGGAGLEADQKVIAAHGCYAMTATTALTAQNTRGVLDIHHTPPAFVERQIDACIDDIGVDVVKCGMLASADTVRVVARALERHRVACKVVDPVMVSTSGAQLLPQDAVATLRQQLIPQTTILTPNIPEAKLLLADAGLAVPDLTSTDALVQLATQVQSLGATHVLLKGGHLPLAADGTIAPAESTATTDQVLDILVSPDTPPLLLRTPRVHTTSTHGTGCSLASAIACNLARGQAVPAAVQAASTYIAAGLRTAVPLGSGHGPINHLHSVAISPYPPGGFLAWLLAQPEVAREWHSHLHHPFVAALADGSLPPASFRHYLVQDYLYLVQFARANALAGFKARAMGDVAAAARTVLHIEREMALHLAYCADEFGLDRAAVESAAEDMATTAYTRYVIDVGMAGDWLALQVAFMPCLLGYGYIGARLQANADGRSVVGASANRWWKWVESYAGAEFQAAVREGEQLLEREAVGLGERRVAELVRIFVHATRMERGFWDMGLAAGQ